MQADELLPTQNLVVSDGYAITFGMGWFRHLPVPWVSIAHYAYCSILRFSTIACTVQFAFRYLVLCQ